MAREATGIQENANTEGALKEPEEEPIAGRLPGEGVGAGQLTVIGGAFEGVNEDAGMKAEGV